MAALRRAAGPLLGLVVAAGLFLDTRTLDELAGPDRLSPGFWPRLTLTGLALTCLARALGDWLGGDAGARTGPRARPAPDGAEPPPAVAGRRLAGGSGLLLGYVLAAPLLGFPLATAAFVVGFMRVAGARSWPGTLAAAVLGTALLLEVFVRLVYLPLPKGGGPFEPLTLALYRALGIF